MRRVADPVRRSKRRLMFCLDCCVGLPLLLALVGYAIYRHNNRPPAPTVPTLAMPADNARDIFLNAETLAHAMKHKSPYDMPGPPAQDYTFANFAACAKDAVPALKVMREGLNHPYMNSPDQVAASSVTDWRAGNIVFDEFRDLARVNTGAAAFEEITGHPDRAAEMRLDGMEMGIMISRGGGLIAGLTGIACEAISERRLELLLPSLSEPELAHIAARLDRIAAKRTPFADIIQEEGYIQIADWARLFKDPKSGVATFEGTKSLVKWDEGTATISRRARQSWQLTDYLLKNKEAVLREYVSWFAGIAAEARKPYAGRSRVPVPDNLLAQAWLGWDARPKFVGREAVNAVLQVETALYRYKRAHGRFPDTLNALSPAYLAKLPDDPCGGGAGKPLQYQVKDGGRSFLLYSLGVDLQDQGGTPARTVESAPGDIVAGKLYAYKPLLFSAGASHK